MTDSGCTFFPRGEVVVLLLFQDRLTSSKLPNKKVDQPH